MKNPIKSRRAGVVTLVAVLIVLALGTAALVHLGAVVNRAYAAGGKAGWHAGFVMGTDIGQSGAALCAIGKYPDWSQCQSFRAKMAEDVATYAAAAPAGASQLRDAAAALDGTLVSATP